MDVTRSDVVALLFVHGPHALHRRSEQNNSVACSLSVMVLAEVGRVGDVVVASEELVNVRLVYLERQTLDLKGNHVSRCEVASRREVVV